MSRLTDPQAEQLTALAALWVYALVNYALLVVLFGGFHENLAALPAPAFFFVGAVQLSYPATFLLIALGPSLLAVALLERTAAPGLGRRRALDVACGIGVALTTAVLLFSYADLRVYRIFGFHLNGFVWNVISTPGGFKAMGQGSDTELTALAIAVAVVAAEVLLWLAIRAWVPVRWLRPLAARRAVAPFLVLFALLAISERLAFGWSDLGGFRPVLRQAQDFPLYQPFRFKGIAKSLGYAPARSDSPAVDMGETQLRYPLAPLTREPGAIPYNVVWLCAESLRADMLTPEIMPATQALAQRSAWFRGHVSGGNGTRMGVFSMWYGLPGNYWFSILAERTGPVLVDLLLDANYQLEMFTSDDFSYPEFSSTIFARLPITSLHEFGGTGASWERDRENIRLMEHFIETRDPDRPFFTFSFLESPHAKYDFPEESVIRKPYLERMNYVSVDLEQDIDLVKNRYVNSVHHLDSQIDRLVRFLDARGLLERTIVIVTGDHGEAFLEHGRWGHNSDFTEEQIRVPLVIFVPGRAPEVVDRLTSHLDLPATLMGLLGSHSDPADYSVAFDLFGPERRRFAVVSDWTTVVYVDDQLKIRFPTRAFRGLGKEVWGRDDEEIESPEPMVNARSDQLAEMLQQLGRFRRAPGS